MNAFKVGQYVRIEGLIGKPELNGSVGVVKSLGEERHQVKVLLKDLISAPVTTSPPKRLSSFFETLRFKAQNLIPIGPEDWKTDFALMFSEKGAIIERSVFDSLLRQNLD